MRKGDIISISRRTGGRYNANVFAQYEREVRVTQLVMVNFVLDLEKGHVPRAYCAFLAMGASATLHRAYRPGRWKKYEEKEVCHNPWGKTSKWCPAIRGKRVSAANEEALAVTLQHFVQRNIRDHKWVGVGRLARVLLSRQRGVQVLTAVVQGKREGPKSKKVGIFSEIIFPLIKGRRKGIILRVRLPASQK